MDLLDSIRRWHEATPDHNAHISQGRSLTYAELWRGSDKLAGQLARLLPGDRSPVIVYGHKEPEMPIGFLGAVKSGHAYIPIDNSSPAQRVERIAQIAGAPLVLTPGRIAELLAEPLPETPAAALEPGQPVEPLQPVQPDEPFYIIFTSGSTGEPKGVVILRSCLQSFLDWMLAEHALGAGGEVFLNQVPFSFDVSMMDTYLCLVTGNTMHSITREEINNPPQLYRTLAASGITFWSSTPSFVSICLVERSFAEAMLPQLRAFVLAGEALSPTIVRALFERFPAAAVWNAYGPTEATILASEVRLDPSILARYPSIPIGYPKPDGKMVIMGPDQRVLPDGERGEIIIAGPHVSAGYAARPDLTERAFFNYEGLRAYHTGDWGYYRDGMVFYDGRMDNQIKLAGNRIELGEVEANLRALPEVRDCVVIPEIVDGQPRALVAFVILEDRPAETDFEVAQWLRRRLGERVPVYMVPRKFRFVERFPMTTNGKADRRRLAEMLK